LSPLLLALSYFLHLLATVIWLGGLMVLTVLVIPEVRRALDGTPALAGILTRLRTRFVPISNLCLAVLLITGMFQTAGDENYEGLLAFNNAWSVAILLKHVAIVGMIAVGLALQYRIVPALERASLLTERGKGDPAEYERLRRRELRLTWLNIAFSVLVLACTAYATAL
jgi:uncharacterized membrane protein